MMLIFILFFIYFFCLHREACGILVPRLGIEPWPSAVKARSPNHCTARELPDNAYFHSGGQGVGSKQPKMR